jgi:hypothetical protein
MAANSENLENNTTDMTTPEMYNICRAEDNFLPFMFSRSQWVPHVGAALAYVLIIQNIIIIRIFLRKELLSPVSILLSMLALSDTLSVFCWFVPEHIGSLLGYFSGSSIESYSIITSFYEQYPFCVIAYISRNILSSGFHSTAIIITTTLGIQKTIVLLYPFLSKSRFTNKCAAIIVFNVFILCLGLEIPYAMFFDFSPISGGKCCKSLRMDSFTVKAFFDFSHHLRSGILSVSILIQLLTTIYITSKLTCRRNTLWRDSKAVRRRNRRSTIIVIYITAIFILSELPSVLVSIFLELRITTHFTGYTLQYLPLIISFGCFFNFWLYLIMSQRFRNELNVKRNSSRRSMRSSVVIV